MDIYNVHDAKTHLSQLLDRVERGEEILLARNGKPAARLVPVGTTDRRPGRLEGRITIGQDFDDPLPDDLQSAFGMTDS